MVEIATIVNLTLMLDHGWGTRLPPASLPPCWVNNNALPFRFGTVIHLLGAWWTSWT